MDVLFLTIILRFHSGLILSIEYNSACKNQFLSSCRCWDSRLSLCEVNQKPKVGAVIGCGDSYLEFLFCHFRIFRLHAKLHDAAGAVHAGSGKRSGDCYMIGRLPNHMRLVR